MMSLSTTAPQYTQPHDHDHDHNEINNQEPSHKVQNLMDLPTELHMQIATYLPYPDALALKHSSHHFYSFVYTGVHLKVDWLVERFELKLECPMERCSFRTDEAFCNPRIRKIMERRRHHQECIRQKGGCLVIGGKTCQKILVPIWLKGQSRKAMLRMVGWEAVLNGLIFLCVNLLWAVMVRVSRLVVAA